MLRNKLIKRPYYLSIAQEYIEQSESDHSCLFIVGDSGMGKTSLLKTVSTNTQQKGTIFVPLVYHQFSSLTVELIGFENVIRSVLVHQGFEAQVKELKSYLAHKIYGDLQISHEPQPIAKSHSVSSVDYRHIFETSERNSITEILESFGQWLTKVTDLISPHTLVLLIDTSNFKNCTDLSDLLEFCLLGNLKSKVARFIFAVDNEAYAHMSKKHGDLILASHLTPFTKEEMLHMIIQFGVTVSDEAISDIWSLHEGNPLDTILWALGANAAGKILDGNRLAQYKQIVEATDSTSKSMLALLAMLPDPIDLSLVAQVLDISIENVTKRALESPLIHLVENLASESTNIKLIHSTAINPILTSLTTRTKLDINHKLSVFFSSTDLEINEYSFYALNPRYLINRLNLWRQSDFIEHSSFLTSAVCRILLRQWSASRFAIDHIKFALYRHGNNLSSSQISILHRDLGYFYRVLGQEEEARQHFKIAVEIWGVQADEVSEETADSLLHRAEALTEQADYLRKSANYEESIDILQQAREHYEMLLEILIPGRNALEMEIAQVTHNLGIVYRDYAHSLQEKAPKQARNLFLKAISHFEEALTVEELHNNVTGQIAALSQIILLNAFLGARGNSDRLFEFLVTLCERIGDKRPIANLSGNLAHFYLSDAVNRPKDAYRYAHMAVNIFGNLHDEEQQILARQLLDKAWQQL